MPSDTTLVATGFRLRRTHEKSRNGCLRCKQQRKKCDELRPSCSRCTKRNYRCRYENLPSEGKQEPIPDGPMPPTATNLAGASSPYALSSDHLSGLSPSSGGQPTASSGFTTEDERLVSDLHSPGNLDATEIGLLGHYLTHTCQTIPVDELDLYALSVGVPNLAFNCKVIMSSLLALAAACKSHDIVKHAQTPLDPQDLRQVQELLALAERHHQASLQYIQAAMHNSETYDYLLANAALMVLYASASHSIRVTLAATAKQYGRRLPSDVLPQHSQWISFTRAAHTASTAVLNHIVEVTPFSTITGDPMVDARLRSPGPVFGGTDVLSPEDGPSEHTKRLFLPLVASTYGRAMESLRRRTGATVALLKMSELSAAHHVQLHASLETVSILEQCASMALSAREGNPPADGPCNRPILFDEFSRVSSWVARYMISVTSMESPRVLRRIIMSFLNKAPAEFLNLVLSVLDSPSAEAKAESWMTRDSPGSEGPALSATHSLAMDIFAHWLVLVMLLDGVWWIGDIGQWELGQIVSLMRTQNLLGQSAETGETWWPESMYLVKQELASNAPC